MASSWIKIAAKGGGAYDAYLALPPLGTGPGLVLFQEIFGVNRHIRTLADQYALDGFVVIAPDVFWREAPRLELGYTAPEIAEARAIMGRIDPARIDDDIATTVAALRARPEVVGKVGAVGYCMGGRLAYFAAAQGGVDAASCYYGGGIQDHLARAAKVACPIQFHYGERDAMIPAAAVEGVRAAFAGRSAEILVYPGADHGFNCWERPSYHQPSAALAHGRTLVHFADHLR
jgi:carboxymethylenebutenolidase